MTDLAPPHEHAHAGSAALKGALTKKIGPLPGWGWALIVVGIAYGYYWYTNRNGTATVTPAADPATDVTDPTLAASDGTTAPAYSSVSTGSTAVTTPVSSNGEWARQGELLLSGEGKWAETAIATALADYVSGKTLSSTQSAIVNEALRLMGPPPSGVLPVVPVATTVTHNWRNPPSGTTYSENLENSHIYQNWPDGSTHYITWEQYAALGRPKLSTYGSKSKPKPVAKPPVKHNPSPNPAPHKPVKNPPKRGPKTYTIKPGDTLSSIARHFYGNDNWQKIWDANKGKIPNPNQIHAGVRIVIPA